jgi:putative acetyltransferase
MRAMSGADMRHVGIRSASASEHGALVVVWERSVRATHHFLAEEDIAFFRPLVAEEPAAGTLELLVVAAPDDAPLGFLCLSGNDIEALFLAPECRGAGLGRRLVEHARVPKRSSHALGVSARSRRSVAVTP